MGHVYKEFDYTNKTWVFRDYFAKPLFTVNPPQKELDALISAPPEEIMESSTADISTVAEQLDVAMKCIQKSLKRKQKDEKDKKNIRKALKALNNVQDRLNDYNKLPDEFMVHGMGQQCKNPRQDVLVVQEAFFTAIKEHKHISSTYQELVKQRKDPTDVPSRAEIEKNTLFAYDKKDKKVSLAIAPTLIHMWWLVRHFYSHNNASQSTGSGEGDSQRL